MQDEKTPHKPRNTLCRPHMYLVRGCTFGEKLVQVGASILDALIVTASLGFIATDLTYEVSLWTLDRKSEDAQRGIVRRPSVVFVRAKSKGAANETL